MTTAQFEKAVIAANLPFFKDIQAIEKEYKKQIKTKGDFTGSVDLDNHFKPKEPQSPRWDYGIGVKLNDKEYAIWVEPHSASSASEVETMLKKLRWLKDKLQEPEFKALKQLTQGVKSYYWLYPADGKCRILKDSKEGRELTRAGLSMPIKQLTLP